MAEPGGKGVAGRLLTQKDYAEARGWSKQYINQLVRKGRIQLVDGKIDPVAADEALRKHRDPTRHAAFRTDGMLAEARVASADDAVVTRVQGSFAKARTVREHYRAMREKLEFEVAAANLVDRGEVELEQFALARLARDRILSGGRQIADAIVTTFNVDERRTLELIEIHLQRLLAEVAHEIAHRDGVDEDQGADEDEDVGYAE